MALEKRKTIYDGKCGQCGLAHQAGMWIFYDINGDKGKKAFCIDCGFAKATAGTTTVKTFNPAVDIDTPEVTPTAETWAEKYPASAIRQHAVVDPLAAAIAAAVEPLIRGKLDEQRVRELIEQHTKPAAHTITVVNVDGKAMDMGRQHEQFETLMKLCMARSNGHRLNIWLTGPAGTGKTTAAGNVARALDMQFAATGSLIETYKVFGFISPGTGKYVETPFRKIWENGGVFIFDDFDGSDPVAVIELNNALANGSCTFPDGRIERHRDCILILTANTFGQGATAEYSGRLKQDAAFLDRFVVLAWRIDESLERDTVGNAGWVDYVQQVRARVLAKGIKVMITPRASYYGAALLETGLDMDTVKAATLRKGMSDEQWRSVC